MKNRIFKLAGLFILFVLPMSLMAQAGGQGRGQGQGDRAARAKDQQEALKKTLELKKDQAAKFDEIYKI